METQRGRRRDEKGSVESTHKVPTSHYMDDNIQLGRERFVTDQATLPIGGTALPAFLTHIERHSLICRNATRLAFHFQLSDPGTVARWHVQHVLAFVTTVLRLVFLVAESLFSGTQAQPLATRRAWMPILWTSATPFHRLPLRRVRSLGALFLESDGLGPGVLVDPAHHGLELLARPRLHVLRVPHLDHIQSRLLPSHRLEKLTLQKRLDLRC